MATILNNKKSTGGSPYCYYTVTANTSNRTAYGVTISGTISSHLASNSSSLTNGDTMGLDAYLTFNGVEQTAVRLKEPRGDSWTGTTVHNKNYSFTISNLDPSQTVIPVSFRVSRTANAAGDYTKGAALSSTACSDITVEAGLIASTITSVSSGTTDYTPSVVWTPCATSVKFKLVFSYGSWSYTTGIITPSTTSPYTYSGYTITGANLASYMSSGSGTFTATLYTYDSDGTTQIGNASSKTFTVTLNGSYKPTASVGTFTDAGGLVPSGWGVFVQGKSKLSFTVSASASTGSTISSYSTSVNGATYNTTSITTGWLTGSGSADLTVTDSRGRTATASRGYTVYPYSNPVIIVAYVTRCLSDGTPSDTGTCLLYTFASTISTCNGNNTATYELGYREKGSNSAYTYVTAANDVPNSVYTGYNFVATTSYDIRFRVTDVFGSMAYEDESIGSSFKLVHYNKNKQAIAIGKYSSAGAGEKKLEVAMNTDVTGDLGVSGNTTINGIGRIYPPSDVWTGLNVHSSNRNEASIAYHNQAETKRYVAGYGTAGFDGWGVYCDETAQNLLRVDKDGNSIATKSFRIPRNSTDGYGLCNTDGTSIIKDWNNGSITVNGVGGDLYLGHQNTNSLDFLNGKGKMYSDGSLYMPTGFYSKETGNVGTASGTGKLVIKRATSGEAPNNGVVLEFGNSTYWTGQLYLGDNADQGIYWNGWSNGTRGSWQKIPLQNSVITGTSGLSKGGGNSNLITIEWVKWGRIVNLHVVVTTTAQVNSGSDIMTGSITDGNLTPYVGETDGLGYYGGRCVAFRVRNNNTFVIRNAGYASSGIGSGSTISVSITYISAS